MSVDLPQPDSPTMPKRSPGRTSKLDASSASTTGRGLRAARCAAGGRRGAASLHAGSAGRSWRASPRSARDGGQADPSPPGPVHAGPVRARGRWLRRSGCGRRSRSGNGAGRRDAARDRRQPVAPAAASRSERRAGLRCRGAAAAVKHLAAGPASTTRPPYMTGRARTRARRRPGRGVMNSSARPRSAHARAMQVEHLRLHGDVQRGGRLVADQQRRVVGEGDGEHDALALAAGELVRVGARRRAGSRQPTAVEQLDRRARGRAPRRGPAGARGIASATWSPTRIVGLSAVIGSWNTMATSAAAQRGQVAFGARRRRSRRRRRAGPSRRRGSAVGQQARCSASAVSDLPEPDSPISPTRSPRGRCSNDTSCRSGSAERTSSRCTVEHAGRRPQHGALARRRRSSTVRQPGSSGRAARRRAG